MISNLSLTSLLNIQKLSNVISNSFLLIIDISALLLLVLLHLLHGLFHKHVCTGLHSLLLHLRQILRHVRI